MLITATDIDQKVRAEMQNVRLLQTMREQKDRLDDVLNGVDDVIWQTRADTFELMYTNPACIKVYGYTPEEMMADSSIFFRCVHPDDKAMFTASMNEVLTTGKTNAQFRIIDKCGRVKYLKGNARLKKGTSDMPDMLSGITVDITELVSSENAVKKMAKQVGNILKSISEGFYLLDMDMNITYANKAFERITGRSGAELLGKPVWSVFSREAEPVFYKELRQAFKTRKGSQARGYYSAGNKWLQQKIFTTSAEMAVYLSDVTDEERLEHTIANSEKKLRSIINNTKDLIWSVDRSFNVIEANEPFWEVMKFITGKDPDQISYAALIRERYPEWQGFICKSLCGESYKLVHTYQLDKARTFESSFNPIYDNRNAITGVACFSRDITEEKELQQKLDYNRLQVRALIDNTADQIWSVDTELNITALNHSFSDLCLQLNGQVPVIGSRLEFTENSLFSKFEKSCRQALEGNTLMAGVEYDLNNEQRFAEIRFNPIHDRSGCVVGVSCLMHDITESHHYISKIQEQNRRLMDIAWIQSHKVRSHVATILGLTQLFNHQDYTDSFNGEVIRNLTNTVKELDEVIHEINRTAAAYDR